MSTDRVTIDDIMQSYKLGKITHPIVKLTGGCCHQVFKIQTNKGIFIFKKKSSFVVEFLGGKQQLLQQLQLMDYLIKMQIPIQPILYDHDDWQILPWIEGQIIDQAYRSKKKIAIISKLLAKIHQIKMTMVHPYQFYASPWQYLSATDWQYTFKQAKYPYDHRVSTWQELFFNNRQFNQPLVIGHGDLNLQNIIWVDDQPFLIDWESIGLVDASSDLLNTALCWNNFLENEQDTQLFYHMIKHYQKNRYQPITFSTASIHASLGYWLVWLKFCLLCLSGYLPTIIKRQAIFYKTSIAKTMYRITWLLEKQQLILTLANHPHN